MTFEFKFLDDGSEPWDVVTSDAESNDFHFIPAFAKSKVGSSANLPVPAPLLLPPPQPKKGSYELPRSQPLGIPKFRPPSRSAAAKLLPVSSPSVPSVSLHSTSRIPISNMVDQPLAGHTSLKQQFPVQRVRPVNPTVSTRTKFPSQCEQLIKLFVYCITQILSCCKLHAITGGGQHPTLHFHRNLDQFAASTDWRYLSIWQQLYDALRDMDLHLDRLTVGAVAERRAA